MHYEHQYLAVLQSLTEDALAGKIEGDRTGTGTARRFGAQLTADLRLGFPLLTTKSVFWKGVLVELLWFLRGDTNIKFLNDHGVHIWDEWADDRGNLGPVYGAQWRRVWTEQGPFDQIANVIDQLRNNPQSRRIIVDSWNVDGIPDMRLPPCHCLFQFATAEGKYLDLQLYQRSADWFLGVPFNAASYSLLLMIIAGMTGFTPRYFIHTFGDYHLYSNHVEQAQEQLSREVRTMPTVQIQRLREINDPEELQTSDFGLWGYNPHPAIKAEVSV